jgi:hypothetical protein
MKSSTSSGQVKVRYTEDKGTEKIVAERPELPPDVANGLLFTLVKDIEPSVPQTIVSMMATTPKPQLVKLAIIPHGFLARLIGKQPPDTHTHGFSAPMLHHRLHRRMCTNADQSCH